MKLKVSITIKTSKSNKIWIHVLYTGENNHINNLVPFKYFMKVVYWMTDESQGITKKIIWRLVNLYIKQSIELNGT